MTNGFDLGHDLDIWILKVICDLDHLVTKVRCKDLPDSDWGDFRCRRAVDSSSFFRKYSQTLSEFIPIVCYEDKDNDNDNDNEKIFIAK